MQKKRKGELHLSIENNLTARSDEGEEQEYCFTASKRNIHQETQAVKFNCSCTSGFTDFSCLLLFSSSILSVLQDFSGFNCLLLFFSSSILTVLPDYSGYNCFLWFLKFQAQRLFFPEFYLLINI
jgi:hypothetical protein